MDAITCRLMARYRDLCNDIVAKFCKKQGVDFEFWVGDDVGGIAAVGDMFINFYDIIIDIHCDVPKGKFLDWYWDMVERQVALKETYNYKAYIMNDFKNLLP